MLNRRLIRSKVFQAYYAHSQTEDASLNQSLGYLQKSLKGVERSFLVFFSFPLEFFEFVRREMNPAEYKYLLTDQSRKTFELLSMNGLYDQLLEVDKLRQYIEKPYHRWQDDPELMRSMYKAVQQTDFFDALNQTEHVERPDQRQFLIKFYAFLTEHEEFQQKMDDFDMHWEDERIPVHNAVKRTLEQIEPGTAITLPQISRNMEEDLEFAKDLLSKAVRHRDELEELIAGSTPGWEKERIAKADLILMILALTEMLHFPYVPVKVSLNEYLELAKVYSTPQSSRFLNGILDKLRIQLKEAGRIVKKGRGLIE